MTTVETVNPADGTPLACYPAMSAAEVETAVEAGAVAAQAWGRVPVARRAGALSRLATSLRQDQERYAGLVSQEMGKPLAEARAEVEKSAVTAEYYALHAPALLADRQVDIDTPEDVQAWVSHEPLGLVLAVMPWNFPIWQVMRFAVPTLAAG